MLTLTWLHEPMPSAERWTLHAPGFSSPYRNDSAIGHIAKHGPRHWHGEAQTGWTQTVRVRASTRRGCANALCQALDVQSIGLFGLDHIAFANRLRKPS